MDGSVFGQGDYRVRFDWGLAGVGAIGGGAPVLHVIVDVLSFTTSVSVACGRGIQVYPYAWGAHGAAEFAAAHDAALAGPRSKGGLSLSPASLARAEGIARLVLPSPNGSAISASIASRGGAVVAGCLRNASAVGAFAAEFLDRSPEHVVAVIAAGERWPDGSLRSAAEDLWGAGAVLAALAGHASLFSPEADLAVAAHHALSARENALFDCVSGRELVAMGFRSDVEIAAELDSSAGIPILDGERFVDARAEHHPFSAVPPRN